MRQVGTPLMYVRDGANRSCRRTVSEQIDKIVLNSFSTISEEDHLGTERWPS